MQVRKQQLELDMQQQTGSNVNLHCDPRKLAGIKPLADEKIKPQRDSVAKVPGRRGEKSDLRPSSAWVNGPSS